MEELTLYMNRSSPYAQSVELVLEEASIPAKRYEIDLHNKPDWYVSQVNPIGKVPALTYGGPKVKPDCPSPHSIKLAESLVLLEFIADLYPDACLLPRDPIARARARLFITAVEEDLIPTFLAFVLNGAEPGPLLTSLRHVQALLPPLEDEGEGEGEGEGCFVLGSQWSIADAAVAPFLGRNRAHVAI
ncbi:hypothetical protein B0F90DRAFT_1712266 [Multifurca ochricompacta]|uniref:GST N-terminal domain-containing protein n=1 Tax=Multifurca ochricompacta TaxID=376703 RepID=A0AAD4M5B0_9AGAM|nr:hypothetical protein B0F90DRAFT_1712266 [Multifurca ochricompacta]